jgi:predicted RNase H-like nuclease (RuvC/YqgF family)
LVSKREGKSRKKVTDLEVFPRLEEAVDAAVARVEELRTRLEESQGQGRDMEQLLKQFTGEGEDPATLLGRLRALEIENQELLTRLKKGKEGVDRLLARIRFLEEQG